MSQALRPDELVQRHRELQALKRNLEVEIVAVQDELRAHGLWGQAGRPRIAPTHTEAEALDCVNRYNAGERTPWIVAGWRQYKRDTRRRERQEQREAERQAAET
jgi:hypothetical protein